MPGGLSQERGIVSKGLFALRKRITHLNIGTLLIGLIVVMLIISPDFRRGGNFINILRQSSVLAVVSIGQTFTILLGGIDLSVGSVAAFAGVVMAGLTCQVEINPLVAMAITLLVGIFLGSINGSLIVFGGVPPFVSTLSMLAMARGLTLLFTQGAPITCQDPFFTALAGKEFLFVPISVWITLVLAIAAIILLQRTRYGLHLYATGDNYGSAFLAGIRVRAITFSAYAISGGCAALGGILLSSRLWSAQPTVAVGLELATIAAVVLGGASLFGGIGRLHRTILGALLFGVLSNSMNLLTIPAYVQRVLRGIILIAVVAVDINTRRGSRPKRRKK